MDIGMGFFKKKNAVFLMVIAIISGNICTCAEEPAPKQDEKTLTDNTNQTSSSNSGFNIDMGDNGNLGVRQAAIKMTLAVLMVIVLGGAVIYLSRKILPGLSNMSGKNIKVVETVHLGPRKSVHLLKIGNQQILVGSTNENITKLADISDLATDQIHDS
jgi:flagellar biosynthetic protein FliO